MGQQKRGVFFFGRTVKPGVLVYSIAMYRYYNIIQIYLFFSLCDTPSVLFYL